MTTKPPEAIAARDIRPLRKALFIAVIVVVMAIAAVAGSAWPPDSLIRVAIKIFGIALIFICIVGRTWSRLYVGWHKTRHLISAGPYSVCRNPLYSFSILGAAGAGAQSGSLAVALLVAVPVWYVLHKVALLEEATLARLHGETFQSYLRDVPEFLPRFSLWRDAEMVEVRPGDIVKTLLESCLLLLAVPAFALVEFYQGTGLLPIYYRLF